MLHILAYEKKDGMYWERTHGYFPTYPMSKETMEWFGCRFPEQDRRVYITLNDLEDFYEFDKDNFEFYLKRDPAFGLSYFVMWNVSIKEPKSEFRLVCAHEKEEI